MIYSKERIAKYVSRFFNPFLRTFRMLKVLTVSYARTGTILKRVCIARAFGLACLVRSLTGMSCSQVTVTHVTVCVMYSVTLVRAARGHFTYKVNSSRAGAYMLRKLWREYGTHSRMSRKREVDWMWAQHTDLYGAGSMRMSWAIWHEWWRACTCHLQCVMGVWTVRACHANMAVVRTRVSDRKSGMELRC